MQERLAPRRQASIGQNMVVAMLGVGAVIEDVSGQLLGHLPTAVVVGAAAAVFVARVVVRACQRAHRTQQARDHSWP